MMAAMREHFLLDPDLVFLNHGSFGATPRVVLQAMQHWQLEMERNPVLFLGRRSATLLRDARERLAQFLDASTDDLVFVPNATTGVNAVVRSLDLQPGDEVLTTDHEYGACIAAFERHCHERGARLRRFQVTLPFDPQAMVRAMQAGLTPRTRLLFFSHVTSTTALVFPAAALCEAARAAGIPTLVDGAHAPGQLALSLNALDADYYSGNGHKWMCAPKGTAFLHARADRHQALHAPVVSWGYVAEGAAGGGHTGFDAYTGRSTLERRLQWQGTRDIAAWLAVPAALDFRQAHDWPTQQRRCRALALDLQRRVLARNGLAAIGDDADFAQMVPVPVRSTDAEGLRRWLFEQRHIEVPVTQHGTQTFVRVSVQAYNTEADLAALESALAEAGV